MAPPRYDLAVVGAGSAGIGAALAAARLGLSVALVEAADTIGGAAVRAGVCNWEPGVGGTGIPYEIYRRLARAPGAVGITSIARHCLYDTDEPRFPGGEALLDPAMQYADTLRRHGARSMAQDEAFCRAHWHGVVFEPLAYAHCVREMLDETGRCTILTESACRRANVESGRLRHIDLHDGRRIRANCFVDATGDAALCRAADCRVRIGQDARSDFGEAPAPAQANPRVNGATLVYRVALAPSPGVEPLPADVPESCWWAENFPYSAICEMPNGDRLVNMLPTLSGREVLEMGMRPALAEATRRVCAHWHHWQSVFPEFQNYRIVWVAPALGLRETWRVETEYVLRLSDLAQGVDRQPHADIVALADHPTDTHGADTDRAGCGELNQPYGVPFRCLLPKGIDNLMVAGRCAGFSSIAASSCRLSRTMMQLGQAAGTAAYLAAELPCALRDLPPRTLRQSLRRQHVQLESPMPRPIETHILSSR